MYVDLIEQLGMELIEKPESDKKPKEYVYSDIRNVCCSLGNDDAKSAFLSAYGSYDQNEKFVDEVVDSLYSLYVACQREIFPNWANDLLSMLKDGRLFLAVEKLLEETKKIFPAGFFTPATGMVLNSTRPVSSHLS